MLVLRPVKTMIRISRMKDIFARWADRARRIATAPHAPLVAHALLGLLALTESIAHAASSPLAGSTGTALYSLVLGLVALATTLPLALLWAQPAAAAVAVSAASGLSLAAFQTLTVAGAAAQLIAVYRLGRHGSPLLAAVLAAPYLLAALAGPAGFEIRVLTMLLASMVPVAALTGIARRARSEALENRAAQQVIIDTLLEHTARGERARIARELHDIVAHHISMVVVQAETARLTTPGMPPAGAQRLRDIGDTARAALIEMRRLLGVLRADTEADTADRQPQPGLHQLIDLVDAARVASGAATRLILRGPPATLDPAVELAAYRIVQEALTNARRHAPGAAVDVELHYAEDGLRLCIRDNGPGPSPGRPTGGHGLPGMRERAAAVGGDLHTGAATGGGFLVTACLPVKEEAAR
jgi:signal transduction histidine kinase